MTVTARNVIDRVRVITGDSAAAIYADADIIRWINDAQIRVVRNSETAQQDVNFLTTQGAWVYPVTGGFLLVRDVWYNGQKVQSTTREKLNLLDPAWQGNISTMRGTPDYYWLTKDTINFYVTPDTSGLNVIATIVPRPPVVVNTTDNLAIPDEMLETIVTLCLEQAKTWDEDWAGAQYFQQAAQRRMGEDAYIESTRYTDTYPSIRSTPGDDW